MSTQFVLLCIAVVLVHGQDYGGGFFDGFGGGDDGGSYDGGYDGGDDGGDDGFGFAAAGSSPNQGQVSDEEDGDRGNVE